MDNKTNSSNCLLQLEDVVFIWSWSIFGPISKWKTNKKCKYMTHWFCFFLTRTRSLIFLQ